jgi:tetratricopeptide (TPR) repeat protein
MIRKTLTIAALAAVALLGVGCNKLKSRDNLNKGVQEFRNAKYPEAIEKFKTAVALDPSYTTARLYLAMAYMQQYIPGAKSPENKQYWQAAFDQFQKVVDSDPKNTVATASIASLYFNEQDWDNAKRWFEKLIAIDPNNKEAYYSLGHMAWDQWYPAYRKALSELNMKEEDPKPIKDVKVREELKSKYGDLINWGIQNLDQAIKIDPEYDDAMTFENLLIRERAFLADNQAECDAQIKAADVWRDKALATIKVKAERKNKKGSGGIVSSGAEGGTQ